MSIKNISFFISLILLMSCGGNKPGSSNKISSSNSSYIMINHDNTGNWVDWQVDPYQYIAYDYQNVTQLEDGLPLYLDTKKFKSKEVKRLDPIPLFILDTVYRDEYNSGYLRFSENPKYFETLINTDAHSHEKKEVIIGKYKQELTDLGFSYKDISFILMQFGVIQTYDHLYAEMIVDKVINNSDFHEIHYNCVYHICTSDCFDPKYKFFIRFDKKTREISVKPK